MLLTGTFERTLDDKLRFALPKSLREALGEFAVHPVYLAPGTDGSLALYPEESFARLAEKLADASPTAMDVQAYRRLFYSRAARAELDRQGRIRLPQDLAELANLEKEIVLLGVQDHIEVWNQGLWRTYLAGRQERYDQIAEAAFGGPAAVVDQVEIPFLKVVDRIPR
ncbi:MAG: division/cell wall cluster transcriptional repressor MraZ [Pirellulales bacterium]|nr:division/cell wall cluster transcriptional repressor MraZ [Pirellulales bacterium]